jgi:glycerol uptake facilitator-like aquaporin
VVYSAFSPYVYVDAGTILTDHYFRVLDVGFIIAQFLGGLVGAGLIYGLYFRAIDIFEGPGVRTLATAGIFATFPVSSYRLYTCFATLGALGSCHGPQASIETHKSLTLIHGRWLIVSTLFRHLFKTY